tara:strand:+ start:22 stop:1044 length:1023 start_codon:yes stop_codon:yes gene_type:complete
MLSAILSLAAPAILGPAGLAVASPMVASAIGGGLGALLQGGKTEDILTGAALGGIGSAIGGSSAFGANPTQGALTSAPGVTPTLNPNLAEMVGPAGGTGLTTPTFTQALTRPEAIGAGIGGLAADAMRMPEYREDEEDPEMPRGMPIKNTSIFPKMGYDAGKMGEFNYRIPRNFAEGGEVDAMDMAMDAGIGGMTDQGMNDKELISSTIDVLQGEIPDEDQQKVILSQFVAQFGQEALQDLMQRVQEGNIPSESEEGDGMVKGAGDGMADMIPANMEGDQDVLLSDGEFVVPADVVSGLGNGSSDAGANKLEDMMDRVRELRTGGKAQPPAIPDEMMLPA